MSLTRSRSEKETARLCEAEDDKMFSCRPHYVKSTELLLSFLVSEQKKTQPCCELVSV